jgi:hypothetical protein
MQKLQKKQTFCQWLEAVKFTAKKAELQQEIRASLERAT